MSPMVNNRPTRSRALLAAFAAVALLASLVGYAAANLPISGVFELDKDATNNIVSTKLGTLKSNTNASALSFVVCTADQSSNIDILIDGEQMHVTGNGTAGGGGCSPKRTLTVQRAQGGTTAASHSGGEDVTLLTASGVGNDDDWSDVYANTATKCTNIGALTCSFVHDEPNHSIYTTGGSKDDLDIPNWRHTNGSVPDADEILDGYAAKYNSSGDQILVFGADRFAVNGSKDFGFWFFKNQVFACPDPDAGSACDGVPDGQFAGTHSGSTVTPGDILILGTFTGGGADTTIRVFKWVGSGANPAATQNGTVEGPDAAFVDCADTSFNVDNGCGTVNDTTIRVPWEYVAKGEATGFQIPSGGFVEGAINLTDLGLAGCFSSFVAETRSSPSVDAQLKDFLLGQFESCGAGLSTAANGPSVSIGSGSVQVTDDATLNVTGTSDWAGTLQFYLCGPAVTTCNANGVAIGSPIAVDETTTNPITSAAATVTSVGHYCWFAFFDSSTNGVPDRGHTSPAECFDVNPVTPTLSTQALGPLSTAVSGPLPFGSEMGDAAYLVGTATKPGSAGPNSTYPTINPTVPGGLAGGSITFTLRGPDNCVATVVAGNPSQAAVSGDGTYYSGVVIAPLPGDYHWSAAYSGDNPNTSATTHNTDCSDTDEDVTVQQLQPTLSSAQSFLPNDSVTVTVETGAGNLDGYVIFELFVDDDDCSGDAAYTSDQIAISDTDDSDGLSGTAVSDNDTVYVVSGTNFYWRITFHSNNTAHKNIAGGCGNENSSITIDNGSIEP
ncbi:MAG TPA: hypothetical protein VFC71_09450 [Candidatus Polarisedimenticolia bacterium]|nr:hypothetical protein [Candidatus Polarisedimenticolia bacterium]